MLNWLNELFVDYNDSIIAYVESRRRFFSKLVSFFFIYILYCETLFSKPVQRKCLKIYFSLTTVPLTVVL